jgi:hypothetical protein
VATAVEAAGGGEDKNTWAEDAERNSMLALAHQAEAVCNPATLRSLANVDEEVGAYHCASSLLKGLSFQLYGF